MNVLPTCCLVTTVLPRELATSPPFAIANSYCVTFPCLHWQLLFNSRGQKKRKLHFFITAKEKPLRSDPMKQTGEGR